MIPTGTPSYMEELVVSKKVYLSASSPALAVLLIQRGLQACAGLHRRTTAAGLLPLAAPTGYQQWQHLPVPDFIQKGSKISVWQQKSQTQLFSFKEFLQ